MSRRDGGRAAFASAAWLFLACETAPWIVANERAAAGEAPTPAMSQPSTAGGAAECPSVVTLEAQRATRRPPLGQLSAVHAGRWVGSIGGDASAAFPGQNVVLELDAAGGNTFTFVNVAPPPAPESAAGSYLCDGGVSGGVCGSEAGFVGGFAYRVEAARSRGNILSFDIIDADPWNSWCGMQTPIGRPDLSADCGASFAALPAGTESWSPMGCEIVSETESLAIDCGRMYALERCACAVDGCIATFGTWIEVGLRLAPESDELSGSLWFRDESDAVLLRLRRQ